MTKEQKAVKDLVNAHYRFLKETNLRKNSKNGIPEKLNKWKHIIDNIFEEREREEEEKKKQEEALKK